MTSFEKADVIADYRVAYMSRQASLIGRKEVLTGKAKFGIFGDGKEVAQLAMARAFRKGDWRSGYYRDQTFMFAVGETDVEKFFAQLYADPDPKRDPASAGRQMNAHFATRYIGDDGEWLDQLAMHNSSADASPTASQCARLLGLAYASKIYRHNKDLTFDLAKNFSRGGNEVAFGTIGNASTAEGIFWETINAAGVLQVPVLFSIWDDGYGISVPNKYQMTKANIGEIIKGFQHEEGAPGIDLYTVRAWDYPTLVKTYQEASAKVRNEHIPAIIHVIEVTQPQGHSTSGSHERYKDQTRLAWEVEFDCLTRMRAWMLAEGLIDAESLARLEEAALVEVESMRQAAWDAYVRPMQKEREEAVALIESVALEHSDVAELAKVAAELKTANTLFRRTVMSHARRASLAARGRGGQAKHALDKFIATYGDTNQTRYSRFLHCDSAQSTLNVSEVAKIYPEKPESLQGWEVINAYWHKAMQRDARIFVIGEDVGFIGGVNQGFKGVQEKFGEIRITDTGIREATILGQGLGAAMRGLRPVVDIQYLDYLLYAFQIMSDDLATLHYRSAGGQLAPVVIRTRGHRLEGIWHTGSPMGTIINGARGVFVCVPRDFVQAAGMYNTALMGQDPVLVVEVLNGYRVREKLPSNLGDYTIPFGIPEILQSGTDVTLVTYGACVRVANDACQFLASMGISVELIDVRTLLPFDLNHQIGASIDKTNAVVFLDEDVPGGASAYMMREVLDSQKAYNSLDAPPICLSAKPHRSAYGSDGDYWSKPNAEDIVEAIYDLMHERNPAKYP